MVVTLLGIEPHPVKPTNVVQPTNASHPTEMDTHTHTHTHTQGPKYVFHELNRGLLEIFGTADVENVVHSEG